MLLPPLLLHTEFTNLSSSVKLDDLISFALKNGLTELVITDHNTMMGVGEFVEKCEKNNIKPVIGLHLDVEDFELVLIAKNYLGYQELMRLATLVDKEGINFDDIKIINLTIIDHPERGFMQVRKRLPNVENIFIPFGSDKNIASLVYCEEVRALSANDGKTLEVLYFIKNNSQSENIVVKDIVISFDDNDVIALQNKKIIMESNIVFPTNITPVPKFENIENISSYEMLKKLLTDSARKMLPTKTNQKDYVDRLEYELKIIHELGFEDYFLIIADLIKWSRGKGIIIGPGRGSAAGSLIAYLLDITQIDPLENDLLFERFLNPQRVTMPDIDIDIQDDRREEVIEYIFSKYENNHVALISTFQRIQAKMAIRDAGRYLGMPMRDVNDVSKVVLVDSGLEDSYKNSVRFRAKIDGSEQYTQLYEIALKIEGIVRQHGTHAAGIVISNGSVFEKVPTIVGMSNRNQTQYSMNHLEKYGLLKIDLLGLRNLKIIQLIQKEIFSNYKKKVSLIKIPLNDVATNRLLTDADTNGIFQLESYGMKKTLNQIRIDNFNDLVAIISLYRPGPLEFIPIYASRKNLGVSYEKIAPEYDEIVKDTYGIIVYQEQIMFIAQKFAGMSFGESDILRRAISKKKITLISSLKEKFFKGALAKGNSAEAIEGVYSAIEKFANYGFNKSHAVSYATLSYWMAYFKVKFPFEFYTALLIASTGSQQSTEKYVVEAKKKNILVISPNINISRETTFNLKKSIILPLTIIKGVGSSANMKIINERKNGLFTDFFNFVARVKIKGVGHSLLELLVKANALREFGNVQTLLDSLPTAVRYADMIITTINNEKVINFDLLPKPLLMKQERNEIQEMDYEKRLFGFSLNIFPTTRFELDKKLIDVQKGADTTVVVMIKSIKTFMDKNGSEMAIVELLDSTSTIEVFVFSSLWKFLVSTKKSKLVKVKLTKKTFKGKDNYNIVERWTEVNTNEK